MEELILKKIEHYEAELDKLYASYCLSPETRARQKMYYIGKIDALQTLLEECFYKE